MPQTSSSVGYPRKKTAGSFSVVYAFVERQQLGVVKSIGLKRWVEHPLKTDYNNVVFGLRNILILNDGNVTTKMQTRTFIDITSHEVSGFVVMSITTNMCANENNYQSEQSKQSYLELQSRPSLR